MIIIPREASQGRQYSLGAMLAALAYWSIEGLDGGEVRRRISPEAAARGYGDPSLWASLRRWVHQRHRLWPQVRVAERGTRRETAASLVGALCARLPRAPPSPTVADAWTAAVLL